MAEHVTVINRPLGALQDVTTAPPSLYVSETCERRCNVLGLANITRAMKRRNAEVVLARPSCVDKTLYAII